MYVNSGMLKHTYTVTIFFTDFPSKKHFSMYVRAQSIHFATAEQRVFSMYVRMRVFSMYVRMRAFIHTYIHTVCILGKVNSFCDLRA